MARTKYGSRVLALQVLLLPAEFIKKDRFGIRHRMVKELPCAKGAKLAGTPNVRICFANRAGKGK